MRVPLPAAPQRTGVAVTPPAAATGGSRWQRLVVALLHCRLLAETHQHPGHGDGHVRALELHGVASC